MKSQSTLRILWYSLAIILGIIWLASCAQQSLRGPTGGPRDETPPLLDTIKSTPNEQTNFEERQIELVFDEFIQTRNLINKVLISPPLQYLPKLESRGKKITIEFNEEEVLKEDATYIFNFGDAVADFREGNKMENLTFVFSTGDVIDSLTLNGTIVDALTGKGVDNIYVMLHDNIRDSIVYEEKPFYFVNTDKDGNFQFQNIRADTFLLFVLKDGNINYTYDEGIEQAGFIDDPIILTPELDTSFTIEVFTEVLPPEFSKVESQVNGKIKLLFKNELTALPEFRIDPPLNIIKQAILEDTLILHYTDTLTTNLYIEEDTIELTTTFTDSYKDSPLNRVSDRSNIVLSPVDSLEITWDNLLQSVMIDSISVTDTTGNRKALEYHIIDESLYLKGNWNSDSLLSVSIPPGVVQDIHGRKNDTIEFTFVSEPIEKFGDIIFTLKETEAGTPYFIQLKRGADILKETTIVGGDSTLLSFLTMPAGNYEILILEDRNGDQRWTPGKYIGKRRSEDQETIKLDALRENWELQAKYNWRSRSKDQ